jgi:hypothetical protein
MQQDLAKILQKAKFKPEENLPEKVWSAVVLYDKKTTRLKLWFFSCVGFLSLVGIIPMFKILLTDFAQSGFYEYLSLAFSSSGSIIKYWGDFTILLAESLPVVSIIASLTLVFIFFISLKYTMREIIKSQLALTI